MLSVSRSLLVAFSFCLVTAEKSARAEYQVGRSRVDITGPALDVELSGFLQEGQAPIGNGIHFRQWSRAFVIADPDSGKRIAIASVDLSMVTHAIHRSVVDNLESRFGDRYTLDNTIISATHTHAGVGGFLQYGVGGALGGKFYQEYFDVIVKGISDSIAGADADLREAEIRISKGIVQNAGANRSAPAYLNNPESERARYEADTDKEMTLLKFTADGVNLGLINWFAVHPTAMGYRNTLISGDLKGHASYLMESKFSGKDDGFIAAFAQSNCGDVTPNLNLDTTGPGANNFETTRIIAERQVVVAMDIHGTATEKLSGKIDYRHMYLDFYYQPVDKKFTGEEGSRTCPSAIGYAAAAGSTEDGGTMAMFKEGMTVRNKLIDAMVKQRFKLEDPSDELCDCQGKKAVLIATGETKPDPAFAQVLPVTLARVGQLAIVAVPAEFTTMSGRRLREMVAEILGDSVKYVVLAGYSNHWAAYVTTKEEYDMQQYEGGHTLYGPWTLAAYQQAFARMAEAMRDGRSIDRGPMPRDMRGTVPNTELGTGDLAQDDPDTGSPGAVTIQPNDSYQKGGIVEVSFQSANPRDGYPQWDSYLRVEREIDGAWSSVATDNDWATKCQWVANEEDPKSLILHVTWEMPKDIESGSYRIGHVGTSKKESGNTERFAGYSQPFQVK